MLRVSSSEILTLHFSSIHVASQLLRQTNEKKRIHLKRVSSIVYLFFSRWFKVPPILIISAIWLNILMENRKKKKKATTQTHSYNPTKMKSLTDYRSVYATEYNTPLYAYLYTLYLRNRYFIKCIFAQAPLFMFVTQFHTHVFQSIMPVLLLCILFAFFQPFVMDFNYSFRYYLWNKMCVNYSFALICSLLLWSFNIFTTISILN